MPKCKNSPRVVLPLKDKMKLAEWVAGELSRDRENVLRRTATAWFTKAAAVLEIQGLTRAHVVGVLRSLETDPKSLVAAGEFGEVRALAERLGKHTDTLLRAARSKRVRSLKIGKRVLLHVADVEAYAAGETASRCPAGSASAAEAGPDVAETLARIEGLLAAILDRLPAAPRQQTLPFDVAPNGKAVR